MNKRIAAIAVASLTAVGCSGGEKTVYVEVPASTVETTSTTAEPTTTTEYRMSQYELEQLFISSSRGQTTELWSLPDDKLLEFGYTTCNFFDQGGSNSDLMRVIAQTGTQNNVSQQTMVDLAAVTGVAVAILCPEHLSEIGM